MHRETVRKTSEARSARGQKQTGAPRSHAAEHQTTSTSVPTQVPENFLNSLGEMHTAEKELTRALPLVAKAAKSEDLTTLLEIHLKQTKGHVKILEAVAESLGEKLPKKSCKQMTKLIGEGVKVIAKRLVSGDKDRELIGVGQKIEQFEIDNYSPLCDEAKRREYTHEFALLKSVLDQEKLANELLGALGQGKGPLDKLVKKVVLEHAGADIAAAEAA